MHLAKSLSQEQSCAPCSIARAAMRVGSHIGRGSEEEKQDPQKFKVPRPWMNHNHRPLLQPERDQVQSGLRGERLAEQSGAGSQTKESQEDEPRQCYGLGAVKYALKPLFCLFVQRGIGVDCIDEEIRIYDDHFLLS
ncbi:MAG: hypothetical protein ABJC09_10610 [Terriglobia bacterium]